MSLVLTIPELAPAMNVLMRMHFRTYAEKRDRWKILILEAAGVRRIKGVPVAIELVRYYPGRPLDPDNLYASCKIPFDAMRNAGIITDDNPDIVTSLVCRQFKAASAKEQRTVITLTPV